jgi:hypothetical protein
MPAKYYESIRKAVEDLLRAGVTPYSIERDLQISHQWVYQLRQLVESFGTSIPAHPVV